MLHGLRMGWWNRRHPKLAQRLGLAKPARDEAVQLHAEIRANAAGFYAGRVSHETFKTAQRSAWGRAASLGVAQDVSELVRRDLPALGKAA